jgi:hypothetical protein
VTLDLAAPGRLRRSLVADMCSEAGFIGTDGTSVGAVCGPCAGLHEHIMVLCNVRKTVSNSLFSAVVPDDQIDQILHTTDIASYCFHGNQGLLAKAVAEKGDIVSNLNMNTPESRVFFTRVMTAVFVMLVKSNTVAPETATPFCYVGASQARLMDRAKQSFDSDKETRDFYKPRTVMAFAVMLQEKDDPNQEDCVEALVYTFRVRPF